MADPQSNEYEIRRLGAELHSFRETLTSLDSTITDMRVATDALRTFMDQHHDVGGRMDRLSDRLSSAEGRVSWIMGVGTGLAAVVLILQILILVGKLGV